MEFLSPIKTIVYGGTFLKEGHVYSIVTISDVEVEIEVENEPVFVDLDEVERIFGVNEQMMAMTRIEYLSNPATKRTSLEMLNALDEIHGLAKNLQLKL
jgi:hypothetical protein